MATKVGIDFGTSYTKITYTQNGKINDLHHDSMETESNIFATAVAYSLETSDIWVEKHAIEKIGHPKIEFYNHFRKYLPLQGKELLHGGWNGSKTPEEVTYQYFDNILKRNSSTGKIDKAVVSVPDSWYHDAKNTYSETLSGILEKLNIDVSYIYSEPICAAAAYVWQKKEKSRNKRINSSYNLLIIDIGSHTIDLTLCQVKKDIIEVIGRYGGGQNSSGAAGAAFDRECVLKAYRKSEETIDIYSKDFYKLCYALEREKKEEFNHIHILNPGIKKFGIANTPIYSLQANGQQLYELSIKDVFQVFEPMEQRIIKLLDTVTKDASQKAINIDEVLIIGGFTNYPLVQNTIRNYVENNINATIFDQDEFKRSHIISLGAFYLAEERLDIIAPYPHEVGIRTRQVKNFKSLYSNLPIINSNKEHMGMAKPRFLEKPDKKRAVISISGEDKIDTLPIYLKTYGKSPTNIPVKDVLSSGSYFISFQIDRLNTTTIIFENISSKEKKEYHLNQLEFKDQ